MQMELTMRPKTSKTDIQTLLNFLRMNAGWHKAEAVCNRFGITPNDGGKRFVRAIVGETCGEVLSGQRGYKHIDHASQDEINHAANWLESQAREMTKRAAIIRNYKNAMA